ncbi:MAG: DUF4384 domain-containing protein [Deltaproteobacteria bacterium]|nr:DUF4384 domain-containing protein [Deltaproteobacteria bacterium]
MKRWWIFIISAGLFLGSFQAWAQMESFDVQNSVILEVEGHACMGEDKSRKETRELAMAETKRKAAEMALTHIKSETEVKNAVVSSDIINAYAQAKVRVIEEIEKGWFKTEYAGECYKVKIKAEVAPDPDSLRKVVKEKTFLDNPNALLTVKLWTDKKEYQIGEKIKIYLKGNKPFFARIIYQDAEDHLIQLIPNPYRSENYFNGGVIYEIPSGKDRFELEVSPPLGLESITLYASTTQLGELDLIPSKGIYMVRTGSMKVGVKTRGGKIAAKKGNRPGSPVEFGEAKIEVNTVED